jgi:ketosteroid isomerase-like protein
MGQNVDSLRALYDAFAVGDVPAVLAAFDADIEWTDDEGFPYGGTYRGPDAILQGIFMRLGTEWDGYSAVPSDFVDGGEKVVALGMYSGTYKATGKSFRAPFAHLWEFRNGKAVRFEQFTDTVLVQEALKS